MRSEEDFYELVRVFFFVSILMSPKCKSYVYVRMLTLQEVQIPPRFNIYLVINKCITALIL